STLPRRRLRMRCRARTSSSTINVRMGFIVRYLWPVLFAPGALRLRLSKRNRHLDNQPAFVGVLDLYPMVVAIELAQSGACVCQPDAFLKLFITHLQTGAIINHLQFDHSVPPFSADFDAPGR